MRTQRHTPSSRAQTLLLVVDVQEGFVVDAATQAIVLRINMLIDEFSKDAVVASKFVNPHGSLWESLMGWDKLKDAPETNLHHGLKAAGVRTFTKNTYSAWSGELQKLCEERQITTIYLCGIDTDQCVLATAADIFSAGIKPIVITDCCASSAGAEFHAIALKLLERLIGKDQLTTSAHLL